MGVYEQTRVPAAGFVMMVVLSSLWSEDTDPLTMISWITADAGRIQMHRIRRVMDKMCFMNSFSIVILRIVMVGKTGR